LLTENGNAVCPWIRPRAQRWGLKYKLRFLNPDAEQQASQEACRPPRAAEMARRAQAELADGC